MKKFDRDLIQETIDEMGLTITFDNEESGFIDDNGELLFMDIYMAEMQDVFQFIRGMTNNDDLQSSNFRNGSRCRRYFS